MRRKLLGAITGLALLISATAAAHEFDHPVPSSSGGAPTPAFMSGGTDAQWELIDTISTGNPHTDLDFFTKDGETFASVGTLAASAPGGGQNIIRLTQNGQVTRDSAAYVSGLPSASCVTDVSQATGLQHDVEATPKGPGILSNGMASAEVGNAQLLLDATDNPGRCHDQGPALGFADAPQGGLEIVDITDPTNPEEIGLMSHIGESHTVNVDPRRPHIAYSVTSDAVTLDPATGQRNNEKPGTPATPNPQRFNLDGFEVIDLSSCMNFPAGTSRDAKRAACRPEVFRYRYPTVEMALGHSVKSEAGLTDQVFGCHELEIYADDRLTCGSGGTAIVFDVKDTFDANGKPKGTALDCAVRDNRSPLFDTGAKVTDCVVGTGGKDLTIPQWIADGSDSLSGVKYLGSVYHAGRAARGAGAVETFPSEDIDFNHETELSGSGNFLLATDERGGGVEPPGAACSPGADNPQGNGGVHAYKTGAISSTFPSSPEEAHAAYARDSKDKKSIYRAPIRTGPQGTFCTAHVFQQVPGQNRIFMGWYTQGTQVVDFTENPDGTLDFKEAAYFIPGGANTWVSHVFKVERTPDCKFAYYGATGDFGRAAIDVYKVTLPPPPTPRGGAGIPDCTPTTTGANAGSSGGTSTTPAANACASSLAFGSATAKGRARGLAFGFSRRGSAGVTVDVFRTTSGNRVTGERRVKRFTNRRNAFFWNGRGRGVRDGYYIVRFTVRAPNGRNETRRVGLVRRNGRFRGRPLFSGRDSCGLLQSYKLERPVFGGRGRRSLGISFRVAQSARVAITVRRGSKTVKRFAARSIAGGRTYRLRLAAKGLRRGDYKLTLVARRGNSRATSVLTARKL